MLHETALTTTVVSTDSTWWYYKGQIELIDTISSPEIPQKEY